MLCLKNAILNKRVYAFFGWCDSTISHFNLSNQYGGLVLNYTKNTDDPEFKYMFEKNSSVQLI